MIPNGVLDRALRTPGFEDLGLERLKDVHEIANATVEDWRLFAKDIVAHVPDHLRLPALRLKSHVAKLDPRAWSPCVWLSGRYFFPIKGKRSLKDVVDLLADALLISVRTLTTSALLELFRQEGDWTEELLNDVLLLPHWFDFASLESVEVVVEGERLYLAQPAHTSRRVLCAVVEWYESGCSASRRVAFYVTPVPPVEVLAAVGANKLHRYDDPYLPSAARFLEPADSETVHVGSLHLKLKRLGYMVFVPMYDYFVDPLYLPDTARD